MEPLGMQFINNKLLILSTFLALTACGSGGSSGVSRTTSISIDLWTWVSGSNEVNQSGVYGIKGMPGADNLPGARRYSITWTDSSGDLWLFGGSGYDSIGVKATLNDLWKFDGTNWTWVSGSDVVNQSGTYFTKGTADSNNIPGARSDSVSWIDSNKNLWLFGGIGFDSMGTNSRLNDLWKFDGSNWTWISGSDVVNQSGIYGTKGQADAKNIPGAREGFVSWNDSSGNLWLFGGTGYDITGALRRLNDLWKFDGSNWTWVSGSSTGNQTGIYGEKGIASASSVPGSRRYLISWIDSSDNLWLFGGGGYDSTGIVGNLNDLWKFDGTSWTWVSGSDIRNQPGSYGTKNISNSTNIPGRLYYSISWSDPKGNLWLFGGSDGSENVLNDLWKFDGTNWTWVSGSGVVNQSGTYATKGTADSNNIPGARYGLISWTDTNGNLWLFGGIGYDSIGTYGTLNDLWKYEP